MVKKLNITYYALAIIFVSWISILFICHYWSVSIGHNGFSPIIFGADDGIKYYDEAVDVLDNHHKTKYIYSAIIAKFMTLTGVKSVLFYKIINFIVAFLSLIIIQNIFKDLTEINTSLEKFHIPSHYFEIVNRKCFYLILFLGLYPSYILFSFPWTLLRDGWISLLFFLSVFLLNKIFYEKRFIYFAILFLCCSIILLVLYKFRFYIAISFCIGGLVSFLLFRKGVGIHWKLDLKYSFLLMGIILFSIIGFYNKVGNKLYHFATYRNNYVNQDAGSSIGIKFHNVIPIPALDASKPSPQKSGEIILISASSSNIKEPFEYQFLIRKMSKPVTKWEIVQDYSPLNSYTWNTTNYSGKYKLMVYMRKPDSSALYEVKKKLQFRIYGEERLVSLPNASIIPSIKIRTNPKSPQLTGTKINLIVESNNIDTEYEYQFLILQKKLFGKKVWKIVQDYSPKKSFNWNTEKLSGNYLLQTRVRRIGSTYLAEYSDQTKFKIINPDQTLKIPSIHFGTVFKYVGYYLYSFASNVFGPLPNQIKNYKHLFAFIEGMCILVIITYILFNLSHLNLRGKHIFIQSTIWFMIISFFNDNLGTAMRLRVPGVALMLILFFYIQLKKSEKSIFN